MGPSATWLIGRSDLSLPVFPSLPRSSRRPSQCHPQRTRATHIEHPPPKNGWAGRSRDRDAGDPDDLGPTVLHEQGRRQELFHPRPWETITVVPSTASLHQLRIVAS